MAFRGRLGSSDFLNRTIIEILFQPARDEPFSRVSSAFLEVGGTALHLQLHSVRLRVRDTDVAYAMTRSASRSSGEHQREETSTFHLPRHLGRSARTIGRVHRRGSGERARESCPFRLVGLYGGGVVHGDGHP